MSDDVHYDEKIIAFLEELWGDGFLSPGGAEEVRRVLDGVTISDKSVIDIGCGSGACAILLAQECGASSVVAIDVAGPVCDAASKRVVANGLSKKVLIELVKPGPLPFADEMFDVVFSKDSIIHIPDKEALALEAYRVLKPGGCFAASDWLISHDNTPSSEMVEYLKAEGLDFAMASPARYEKAMKNAGFVDVELVNRNSWYSQVAPRELEWLSGSKKSELYERHGRELIDHQINAWSKMVPVVSSGEHCPHHIRAKKPLQD